MEDPADDEPEAGGEGPPGVVAHQVHHAAVGGRGHVLSARPVASVPARQPGLVLFQPLERFLCYCLGRLYQPKGSFGKILVNGEVLSCDWEKIIEKLGILFTHEDGVTRKLTQSLQ